MNAPPIQRSSTLTSYAKNFPPLFDSEHLHPRLLSVIWRGAAKHEKYMDYEMRLFILGLLKLRTPSI